MEKQLKSLLESTSNTRELGGYRTKQGTFTRRYTLIRSDEPRSLHRRDIAWLSEHRITTIIDMRCQKDMEHMPNPFRKMPQVCYYNIPIEEGSGIPCSTSAVPASYMEIAAAANISQVFVRIAHAPDGVLFHCSAGKDRTGVVSAILLLLAGVSEEGIIQNYMMTREYNRERFGLIRQNFPDIDMNIVMPNEMYMAQFLHLFQEKYGDAENYLRSINVLPEEILQIQAKLL